MVAIEEAPFELTESGWGEFQILIRIMFQDPNQKHIQLSHFLRLYPSQDGTTTNIALIEPSASEDAHDLSSKAIVSETYEEIVFEIDENSGKMADILYGESNYMNLSTSPHHLHCKFLVNRQIIQRESIFLFSVLIFY